MDDINMEDVPKKGEATSSEVPPSPKSSYVNPGVNEFADDEPREPPLVPAHLHHGILSTPPVKDGFNSLPLPHEDSLGHLYMQQKPTSQSVAAFGVTHRYRDKYFTLVLYKPV